MKVKAFKIIPHQTYTGPDHKMLQTNGNYSDSESTKAKLELPTAPKPANVGSKSFRDKYVFSIDGERCDPGHGLVCEVHQGLVAFIADSHISKYQPSALRDAIGQPAEGRDYRQNQEPTRENPHNTFSISTWLEGISKELLRNDKGKGSAERTIQLFQPQHEKDSVAEDGASKPETPLTQN